MSSTVSKFLMAIISDFTRADRLTPEVEKAIDDAFDYSGWDAEQVERGKRVREALASAVKVVVANVPPCPDRTTAIRMLLEARMDANSAIYAQRALLMQGTRGDHLAWSKRRALEYLDRENDVPNAVTSMLSDLSEHPETRGIAEMLHMFGMLVIMEGNPDKARRFIEGFQ